MQPVIVSHKTTTYNAKKKIIAAETKIEKRISFAEFIVASI